MSRFAVFRICPGRSVSPGRSVTFCLGLGLCQGLRRRLAIAGACLVLAACAGSGELIERLDASSGLTIVTDPGLLSFARTDGRLSFSARDYIYLGPVEINERGTRTQYLWVGIATTIDRRFLGADAATPTVLYIDLAGAPAEFELRAREDVLPELAGVDFYEPAVAPGVELLARITVDQLRLLAAGEPRAVRVAAGDGAATEYLLWSERPAWPGFAGR